MTNVLTVQILKTYLNSGVFAFRCSARNKCWDVVGEEPGRVVGNEMVRSLNTSSQATWLSFGKQWEATDRSDFKQVKSLIY